MEKKIATPARQPRTPSDISELFQPDGVIARAFPRFEYREGQVLLARAVAEAMAAGEHLVAEAGTGTGKSLAYLLAALLSGRRTVVSTGTIALQEQLLNQDIPQIERILARPVRAALYKGLGNYFCRYRYEEELDLPGGELPGGRKPRRRTRRAAVPNPSAFDTLQAIGQWAESSPFGDRADLPFAVEPALWANICASSDDCLRETCGFFCHSDNAHSRLKDAELIVTNHALLALDIATRFSLIPGRYEQLVIDEAQRFPEYVTQSLTLVIHNTSLRRLVTRLKKRLGVDEILLFEATLAADELFGLFTLRERSEDRYPLPQVPEVVDRIVALSDRLQRLREAVAVMPRPQAAFEFTQERFARVCSNLDRQLANHVATLDSLLEAGEADDRVSWVEHEGAKCTLKSTPLDISGYLAQHLFGSEAIASIILTSATLATCASTDSGFRFFCERIGLPEAQCLLFASPFDFPRQMLLYTTPHLPEPNRPDFLAASTDEISRILALTRGRAFVLCTSRAAMYHYFDALGDRFNARHQDEMGRSRLLKWFLEAENPVLFATASFWEGISVEGPQLSCIIIDRLPFTSPGDPVYEARCERMRRQTDDPWSWFQNLALPHAAMRLRQGVGRLIRTRDDRGIVAILDSRLHRKNYGKVILQALPTCTHTTHLDGELVQRFIADA